MFALKVAAPLVPVVVSVIVPCFELNVLQSALDKAPLLAALAVGTCKVITGVVVPFATVELKSVPVVPIVRAATEVTVPTNWSAYCGMFKVAPTKVAAPLVPVVVNVIAFCLPLNVVQSVEDKYPLTDVVACAIVILGVVPPLELKGDVAVTEVR